MTFVCHIGRHAGNRHDAWGRAFLNFVVVFSLCIRILRIEILESRTDQRETISRCIVLDFIEGPTPGGSCSDGIAGEPAFPQGINYKTAERMSIYGTAWWKLRGWNMKYFETGDRGIFLKKNVEVVPVNIRANIHQVDRAGIEQWSV